MINLEFTYGDGIESVIIYDVHPRSQGEPVEIPHGARGIVVWPGEPAAGE